MKTSVLLHARIQAIKAEARALYEAASDEERAAIEADTELVRLVSAE